MLVPPAGFTSRESAFKDVIDTGHAFRHFGIEPTLYDLIVVKANTSFKEPYSKFAGHICYADTPGAGASNLKQFEWKNIPKGMYSFDK